MDILTLTPPCFQSGTELRGTEQTPHLERNKRVEQRQVYPLMSNPTDPSAKQIPTSPKDRSGKLSRFSRIQSARKSSFISKTRYILKILRSSISQEFRQHSRTISRMIAEFDATKHTPDDAERAFQNYFDSEIT